MITGKKYFLIFFGIVLVTSLFWFFYFASIKGTENIRQNDNFKKGEAALSSKEPVVAITEFERALDVAKPNTNNEGQAKFKIAVAYATAGDYANAISLFKEVAANTSYENITRAYALQTMAELQYNAQDRDLIKKEIFKDEPYSDILKSRNGDYAFAYADLYKNTVELYPLGVSEIRLANWNVAGIEYYTRHPEKRTSFDIEKAKDAIRENFAQANADITRLESEKLANTYLYIPLILTQKAIILGRLSLLGDTSFGSPEQTFKEALLAGSSDKTMFLFTKYYYATFLANRYGSEAKDEIVPLLRSIYASFGAEERAVFGNINSAASEQRNILLLSTIDPGFREFLITTKINPQFF